jgi:hypothetical protein
MLLIGSRAANYWHPEISVKETTDYDVVCTPQEAAGLLGYQVSSLMHSWKYGTHVELHNSLYFNNDLLEKQYASGSKMGVETVGVVKICSSRGLAIVKRSHLHRDINFTKHMIHYNILDHSFNALDLEFLRARSALTKAAFPERKVFGAMTNEEFVVDGVNRHMDHEELHRIITNGDVSYFKLKKDMTKAAYDHELWDKAPDSLRRKCVQEEAYVIALERFLIPKAVNGTKFSYKVAFYRALEKVCTTLDDGPLREYAIDNWNSVMEFDPTVFDHFFNSKEWNEYANRKEPE